jgi:hypothetical protein
MIKKFRIKHEGFHRIAMLVGIITIPLLFATDDCSFKYDNVGCWIKYMFEMWGGMFKEGFLIYCLAIFSHFVFYSIGYFSVAILYWLTTWLWEGFKK